jgi:hypothetical protein
LVDNQVSEHKTIEYKEALLGNADGDKKEFLADVSSFANESGGDYRVYIEWQFIHNPSLRTGVNRIQQAARVYFFCRYPHVLHIRKRRAIMRHLSRFPVFSLFVFLLLLLAACGNTSTTTGSSSPIQPPAATTAPTATSTPQPAYAGKSAAQIVQALKAKGLPIGEVFSYTAENDQNHLLGRPGQYIGKTEFKDTRIASTNQGAAIAVSDGGSVEVFATVADAQHRFAYLQALSTSGNALFAEYEYLDGLAILRVSSQLTPTEAKAYEAAFKTVP